MSNMSKNDKVTFDGYDEIMSSQAAENNYYRNQKRSEGRGEVTRPSRFSGYDDPEPARSGGKAGRPKKELQLDLKHGINVRFDKELHRKLSLIKIYNDVAIRDFIYMATDYVIREYFTNGEPNSQGRLLLEEFRQKMGLDKD